MVLGVVVRIPSVTQSPAQQGFFIMSRLSAYRQQAVQQLTGLYEAQEAASIVRIWLEEGWEKAAFARQRVDGGRKRMLEPTCKNDDGEPCNMCWEDLV